MRLFAVVMPSEVSKPRVRTPKRFRISESVACDGVPLDSHHREFNRAMSQQTGARPTAHIYFAWGKFQSVPVAMSRPLRNRTDSAERNARRRQCLHSSVVRSSLPSPLKTTTTEDDTLPPRFALFAILGHKILQIYEIKILNWLDAFREQIG
jgi:hypothetical protein